MHVSAAVVAVLENLVAVLTMGVNYFCLAVYRSWKRQRHRQRQGEAWRRRRVVVNHWERGEGGRGG